MDRDDIIKMAKEAGATVSSFHGRFVMYPDDIERFAALVAAHERKACMARGAGITLSKNIQSQTRFHADMVSLDSFAFDVGERRLDHCLKVLRQAGYNEAADYLQGVG